MTTTTIALSTPVHTNADADDQPSERDGAQPGTVLVRVAVIDGRARLRCGVARAVAEDSTLELALSSQCLADAHALASPPDLILLGQSNCDEAADPDPLTREDGCTCSLVRVGQGETAEASLASPERHLATASCSDGDAIRRAIHAALKATAGDGSDDQQVAGQEARPALSLQEQRALALYSSAMTLEEVASAMYITTNTAATYLKRVRAKFRAAGFGVDSKLELRDTARAHGLVPSRASSAPASSTEPYFANSASSRTSESVDSLICS